MTSKQRKPLTDLPIANISLKQFDAETKNFSPDVKESEPVSVPPQMMPTQPPAVQTMVPAVQSSGEKDTKRLTIDLDEDMNRKFSLYALEQGKKKTEIIREWISAAISGR